MTDENQPYDRVLEPEDRLPSWMVALLPAGSDNPSVTAIINRLEHSDLAVADRRMADEREMPHANWELELQLREGDETHDLRIWLEPTEQLDEVHLEWGYLTAEEIQATRESRWSLGVSALFGLSPLEDYHRQLKVLATVAPDAAVTYDISAGWPRSGEWLREAAAARVPPAPENLYCVHVVRDDNPKKDRVWMHTHGLLRCGTIELELIEVPAQDAGTLSDLLNTAAALTIEMGPPPPGEPFHAGQDLVLVWVPWEQGIRYAKRSAMGSRKDRDEFHDGPSGILLVPAGDRFDLFGLLGRRYDNPAVYLPVLANNPLLWVSTMETQRMCRLAKERLDRYQALWESHRDDEDWLFLMKLGYAVDGAEEQDDREHLWFELHGTQADQVEATLVNEPYGITGMHEGDRGWHSLDLLSDWAILCPLGRFDPDNVGRLERQLE